MSSIAIFKANDVYKAAATARVERHSVDHSVVGQFCTRLVRLYRSLEQDQRDDPFWSETMRQLFLARLNLSATPLPFDHPSLIGSETVASLRRQAVTCGLVFPDKAAHLASLADLLAELRDLADNPLLDAVEAVCNPREQMALLVRRNRYVQPLADFLQGSPLGSFEVLTASRLRDRACLDALFVVGPSAWFPAFILTAPRAYQVHLLHYGCIRDDLTPEPVFPAQAGGRPPRLTRIIERNTTQTPSDESVPGEALLEAAVWMPPTAVEIGGAGEDTATARLFLLHGEQAVLLESGSSVIVLDLVGGEGNVHRVHTEEVVADQYVLLRTERGGDYVASVADHQLGDLAPAHRQLQREWKERLRAAVNSTSLFDVSIALLERDSTCADETNVRNWCSPRSIKTHDRRDFAAIMDLIGWRHREPEVWACMEVIDSAHRWAGRRIRQRLLEQVEQADLSQLELQGRVDFELPEAEGGAISAMRVEECARGTLTVPVSRLGQPFAQLSQLWHG